jgi:sec-independent protein translocase protein TatA
MGIGSIWHWIILLVVVVLVFGTKKLRNVGKDLGGAVHDFKDGLRGAEDGANQKKIEEVKVEKESVSETGSKDENKEA